MQVPRTWFIIAVTVLIVGGQALGASGQLHWAIAERSDEEIRSRVAKLMEHLEATPDASQAAAVILEKGHNYRLEKNPPDEITTDQTFRFLTPKLCLNQVILVRDPAALPDLVTQPYFAPDGNLVDVAAFHLRSGKLTRLKDKAWDVEKSDGHITRGRVTFRFPELKSGDVVGYSLVTEIDDPLMGASVAAADRLPVVYYSLRILANGGVSYDIESVGFSDPPRVKSAESKNGKPSAWQVSCTNLAGIADLPLQGPYPGDVPHFDVTANGVFIQSPSMNISEWSPMGGWNSTVALLAGADKRLKTDGLDVRVSALTTGATTPEEKFRAIEEYVRNQLKLATGDRYDPRGMRESARDILGSGEATALEKVMLTVAMAKTAGVEATFVVARPGTYGPANDQISPLLQFPEPLVHMAGDKPGYFAPQCTECPPGTLPASWEGATLLVPRPDIEEVATAFMKKHMQEAMTEGHLSPQALTRAVDAETWYTIETVPASGAGS